MKRTNKERATKNLITFLQGELLPVSYNESLYKTGWNSAIETMIAKIQDGQHTPEYAAGEAKRIALEKAEEAKREAARKVAEEEWKR